MNPHDLLSAMNTVDDDLLNEVDAVRNTPKKHRVLPFIYRIGAAACLCLIVGIGAYHVFAPAPVSDKGDDDFYYDTNIQYGGVGSTENGTVKEPDLYTGALVPDNGMIVEETEDVVDKDGSSRGDGFYLDPPLVDITTDLPDEAYLTVSGTITAWKDNGFYHATVDGEELFITVNDATTFSVTDEFTATFTNAPPTEKDLPVGSAVTVDADPDTLAAKHISKGE